MYLDDMSRPGSGSLALIPGSHDRQFRAQLLPGLRHDARFVTTEDGRWDIAALELGRPVWGDERNSLGLRPQAVPGAVETCTRGSDCLFFHPGTFHSSFNASIPGGKRTFQLIFGKRPSNAMELGAARSFLLGEPPHPEQMPSGEAERLLRPAEPRLRRSAEWIATNIR